MAGLTLLRTTTARVGAEVEPLAEASPRIRSAGEGHIVVAPGEHDLFLVRTDQLRIAKEPWSLTTDPRPNRQAVADLLHFPFGRPASTTASLLRGVDRIAADHSAQLVRDESGWRLTVEDCDRPATRINGLHCGVAGLDAAIKSSVLTCLGAAERPACLVTGGLDSAVVAAMASAADRDVKLVAVDGGLLSRTERRLISMLAEALQRPLLVLEDLPGLLASDLLHLNARRSFPVGGVFASVWSYALDCCTGLGADIVLTGDGGNEVFAAGPADWADLLRDGRVNHALTSLGRARSTGANTFVADLVRRRGLASLPGKGSLSNVPEVLPWYGEYLPMADCSSDQYRARVRRMREVGFTAAEAQARLQLEALPTMGPIPLGPPIEVRAPLATPEVRRAAFAPPPELRNPVALGSQDKRLLRLVARGLLPARITEQKKVGPANQIATVLASSSPCLDAITAGGADRWLGIPVRAEMSRPWRLPAQTGLDWSHLMALYAWATNATA